MNIGCSHSFTELHFYSLQGKVSVVC